MASLISWKPISKFTGSENTVIPVVRLQGTIAAGGSQLSQRINLASAAVPLQKAFSMKRSPAVAIIVNSPGGSPVQSSLIGKRIRALASENDKKVLMFVEDVAASGGYWIACAGDEIYADPTSIVGSIGVVSGGFGFPEALKKLGIERRVYTAGTRKAILDPFRPEVEDDIEHLKDLQRSMHEDFKAWVKERRGDALADNDDLFTGLFWTGRRAADLGLIDGLGDLRAVLRERYGEKMKLKVLNQKRAMFRGLGTSKLRALLDGSADLEAVGGTLAADALNALEDRAMWQRYGL